MKNERWTSSRIRALKGREKIVCVTAADYSTARRADEAGIPLVLVGDSLGMTVLGYETTLPVTMEEMLHHSAAVARGAPQALVVADMPFMSYQVSVEQALGNAGRFLKESGVGAVKVEGGAVRAPTVRALVDSGIPVLGHIGLTPQSVREMGGYKVQGRRPEEAERLLADARALETAGAFAVVVECVPKALGADLTAAVGIPTIGIGAGPACDGQILVGHDLLGLTAGPLPRFARRYAELGEETARAFAAYRDDVRAGRFPADEHGY